MVETIKKTKSSVSHAWCKRTMKRETSIALLIFWAVITTKLFWLTEVEIIVALNGIYGIVTPTIFMFVTAAFGFDAYTKQIRNRQSSGQNDED